MSLTGADFEAVFLSVLQGNDALKALVGDRVFALIIPDGTYLPCVTFQRISGTPANTLGGRSGLEEIEMQGAYLRRGQGRNEGRQGRCSRERCRFRGSSHSGQRHIRI